MAESSEIERDEDRARAEALLADYARLTGAEGLSFDENDSVVIDAEDDIYVNVAYRPVTAEFSCFATVGYLPEEENRETVLRALLRRNRADGGGFGFVNAVEPDTDHVVTHDRRSVWFFADEKEFGAWIEACVEHVQNLRELIETGVDGASPGGAGEGGGAEIIFWG